LSAIHIPGYDDFSAQLPDLDTTRAFVYREKELNEIIVEMSDASWMTVRFTFLANEFLSSAGAELRSLLLTFPQIQTELGKLG
jgi:hypothetical protein